MNRKRQSGFTLVEVTIILLILVVLGAILMPTVERFIDLARIARVKEDVGMLAAIIELYKFDTCNRYFKVDGNSNTFDHLNRVDLLIGDGDTPSLGGTPPLAGDDAFWSTAYGKANFVDTIENQLALGDPFFNLPNQGGADVTGFGADTSPYPTPSNSNLYACGFRGAYVNTPVNPDPWGSRYMVNVAFLGPRGTARLFGSVSQVEFNNYDTFVISAGPDQRIDTEFQPGTPNVPAGVVAKGDDVIAVVAGG